MKSFWFVNLGLSSFCCKQVDIVAKRGPPKNIDQMCSWGQSVPGTGVFFQPAAKQLISLVPPSLRQINLLTISNPQHICQKVRTRPVSFVKDFLLSCIYTPALFIKCPSNSRATATSEEFYRECVFELIPHCSLLWTSIFVRFKRSLLWHCLSENKHPTRRPNIINDLSDLFKENVALLCLFAKLHFLFR